MTLQLTPPSASATGRQAAVEKLHRATAIYTREGVVDELLNDLDWPSGGRQLCDPAAGDGAFLTCALRRLFAARPDASDDEVVALIAGWEIHAGAAAECRTRLADILEERGREPVVARSVAARLVRCGDFLLEGPQTPAYGVISANPPYLRYTNVPEPLRGQYERAMPDYARADMLHSFIDRCAVALHADGEIALVSSDRWLANQNAAKLREVIGARWGIAQLARLDSASAFYRPKVRKQGTPPRVHPIRVILRRAELCEATLGRAAVYPDTAGLPLPADGRTLDAIAKIILAPWVGTPGIFMVDAQVAAASGLPASSLVPAIDTDDVKGGVLRSLGRFVIRGTKDETPPESVLQYLDERLAKMSPRGRRFPRWLTPERLDKHDLSQACLLVPRIAKTLRPVRVPAGILPTDHNLTIVSAGALTLDEIEALLCHPLTQAWMEQRACRLEGGYYSVTTTLLRTLPVWDVPPLMELAA